jgi:hypothetical protein
MNSLGSPTSIEKHMDQLEIVFNWYVLAVLIAFYAGADGSSSVQVLGATVNKDEAYSLILLLFNLVFLIFCHLAWKIGDWLNYCEAADLEGALAAVLDHKWLLNPFEYCGPSWAEAINCSVGTAFLFFLWWAGYAALFLLDTVAPKNFGNSRTLKSLALLLAVVGVACVAVMGRVYRVIFVKLRDRRLDGSVLSNEGLMRCVKVKCASAFVGAALGAFLYRLFTSVL